MVLQIPSISCCRSGFTDTDSLYILLQQWFYRSPLHPAVEVVLQIQIASISCCSSGVTDTPTFYILLQQWFYRSICSTSWCINSFIDTHYILVQQWYYRYPLYPAAAVVLQIPSISCCSSGFTDLYALHPGASIVL